MKQFRRLLWIDVKMQCRVFISLFFALVFPILMLTFFSFAFENVEIPGDYRFVDKYVLVAVGMGTLPTCFTTFASFIGEALHNGTYHRLAWLSVSKKQLFGTTLLSHLFLILTAIGLNLTVAGVLFDARLPGIAHLLAYIFSVLYGLLLCLLIGLLIAFVAPNFKSIMPLSMITMFAFYFVCGAMLPYDFLPEILKNIGDYVPVKYMLQDFSKIYQGGAYVDGRFLLLNTIWLTILAALLFLVWRHKGRKMIS